MCKIKKSCLTVNLLRSPKRNKLSASQSKREIALYLRFRPIAPSDILSGTLKDTLSIVATSGSEKARSEGIIYPVLLEVRRILDRQISLFSGEDFTIDEAVGLSGVFDFLRARSSKVLEIAAPAVVIVEAKKTDLKSGLGQCIAQMVAAVRFDRAKEKNIPIIYGSVSNGIQWQFMKLENQTVTIDLSVYPLPPVEQILSFFVWMMQNGAVNSETI